MINLGKSYIRKKGKTFYKTTRFGEDDEKTELDSYLRGSTSFELSMGTLIETSFIQNLDIEPSTSKECLIQSHCSKTEQNLKPIQHSTMITMQPKPIKKLKNEIHLEDQTLQLVPGQRGKELLILNGFSFATNLVTDKATYWCCRHRLVKQTPCQARARTQLNENGLYTVIISQPFHNHEPPKNIKTFQN